MAKSRAQRKAEQRKRQAQQQAGKQSEGEAQHRTQVPESADVVEAELAERGADLDALREQGETPAAPAPSRGESAPSRADTPAAAEAKESRRERRRAERERRERIRASEERRRPREEPVERQRGRVISFFISCWHELKRVQWPDRQTLIQASSVTLVFIIVLAAYLGALDAGFNWLVKRII